MVSTPVLSMTLTSFSDTPGMSEIATREKQQVQGTEQTRGPAVTVPDVDIREYDDALRSWGSGAGILRPGYASLLSSSYPRQLLDAASLPCAPPPPRRYRLAEVRFQSDS
jgi:hypothetical protein